MINDEKLDTQPSLPEAEKKKKEVLAGISFKVDIGLRTAFEAFARSQDRSASSLIREFMRESVRKNMSSAQMNLLK